MLEPFLTRAPSSRSTRMVTLGSSWRNASTARGTPQITPSPRATRRPRARGRSAAGEGRAADHSPAARHELPARVPVRHDRRDRRQVVERLVLVERRAYQVAQLVLMVWKAEQPHTAEGGRNAERRDRTR